MASHWFEAINTFHVKNNSMTQWHFTAIGFSFHLPTVSSAQYDIISSARLVITHRYRPSLQDWTLEHVSVGVFTP